MDWLFGSTGCYWHDLYPRAYGECVFMVTVLSCSHCSDVIVLWWSLQISAGEHWSWIVRRTLDLVTIVIPPALPAAMTIGIVYAQGRLRRDNIYCINSSLINVSAVVNVFCFDKVLYCLFCISGNSNYLSQYVVTAILYQDIWQQLYIYRLEH